MRNYDVSLIFSPLVEEQTANDILQKLASFVQEKGGILGDQQMRGKRPLLAPIGKHREGYLATFSFTLSPEHLDEFEKYCKEQRDVLRFLIAKQVKKVRKKEPKLALSQTTASLESSDKKAEPLEAAAGEKEEKVNLKDIDEKLEEIFKEPS